MVDIFCVSERWHISLCSFAKMQKAIVLYTFFFVYLFLFWIHQGTLAATDVDDLSSLAGDYPFAPISNASWTNSASQLQHTVNFTDGTQVRAILLRNPYNAGYRFACGFTCNGTCDTFLFSIFVVYVNSGSGMRGSVQIVWSANRESPVREDATLRLNSNGELRLTDVDGTLVWSTNTSGMGVASIQLHKTGNLILADASNGTVWQSWDHMTDSLLPEQTIKSGQRLVGSVSTSNSSEGPYFLAIGNSGLGLYASAPANPQKYWPPEYYSYNVTYAIYNSINSTLDLFDSSGSVSPSTTLLSDSSAAAPNMSVQFIRIDPDGILRVYGANDSLGMNSWEILFSSQTTSNNPCLIPSYCGLYGLCTGGQCSCSYVNGSSLDPFNPVNSQKLNEGCTPSTPLTCDAISQHYFLQLNNVDYFTVPSNDVNYNSTNSMEECKQLCLQNCSCRAAFFVNGLNSTIPSGKCYITTEVYTMRSSTNEELLNNIHYQPTAFIKVQNTSLAATIPTSSSGKSSNKSLVIGVATGLGVLVILSLAVFVGCIYWRREEEDLENDEDPFLKSVPGLPSRFTYQELKEATKNFDKKLGAGGFGSVFLGTLYDGSKIAVKRLEGSSQGQREFRNEVCTIGSIHHFNLVRLCGFCAEKGHRLLVYEFMPNGSLDRWIFRRSNMPINEDNDSDDQAMKPLLDWPTRFNIALGTAQGLAYLHEGCRERIIHFDVKPQNILLDEDFVAKVSDFGLSKFVKRDQSQVLTTMRGTPGYLAPEWLHSTVTEKADVYSFGIVLLEVISGQRCLYTSNLDQGSGYSYLPILANLKVEQGKEIEMVDERLGGVFVPEEAKRAVYVALWCIQGEPSSRPSMSNVVQMLEGNIKVESPPLVSGPGGIWNPQNRVGAPDFTASSTYNGSSVEPWSVPAESVLSMPR